MTPTACQRRAGPSCGRMAAALQGTGGSLCECNQRVDMAGLSTKARSPCGVMTAAPLAAVLLATLLRPFVALPLPSTAPSLDLRTRRAG